MNNLLNIKNLKVEIDSKTILHELNLNINKGEVHIIMGPNGAGKSTLANTILGHPKYKVSSGEINFEGENITKFPTSKRAIKGIFLSFQSPEEVLGVKLETFIRTAKSNIDGKRGSLIEFKNIVKKNMNSLNMSEEYLNRYLNVGFSGGEKKKSEILQMLTLNPKLAILDETDSGLDIDAVKTVSGGINLFKNENNGILIITHNPKFLEEISPDFVHILVDGTIVESSGKELIDEIAKNGFKKYQCEEKVVI